MIPTSDYLIPGETVVLCTHRHILTLAGAIFINVEALVLLSWISYASGEYRLCWVLSVPLVLLLWRILLRARKLYIITNLRVIRQEGLIAVSSLDASLDKINNVFYEQSVAGRILGYGNVGLETASEKGTIVFHFIPDPQGFKNCVLSQPRSAAEGTRGPARAARRTRGARRRVRSAAGRPARRARPTAQRARRRAGARERIVWATRWLEWLTGAGLLLIGAILGIWLGRSRRAQSSSRIRF